MHIYNIYIYTILYYIILIIYIIYPNKFLSFPKAKALDFPSWKPRNSPGSMQEAMSQNNTIKVTWVAMGWPWAAHAAQTPWYAMLVFAGENLQVFHGRFFHKSNPWVLSEFDLCKVPNQQRDPRPSKSLYVSIVIFYEWPHFLRSTCLARHKCNNRALRSPFIGTKDIPRSMQNVGVWKPQIPN